MKDIEEQYRGRYLLEIDDYNKNLTGFYIIDLTKDEIHFVDIKKDFSHTAWTEKNELHYISSKTGDCVQIGTFLDNETLDYLDTGLLKFKKITAKKNSRKILKNFWIMLQKEINELMMLSGK